VAMIVSVAPSITVTSLLFLFAQCTLLLVGL
jgi:hypothetical protein